MSNILLPGQSAPIKDLDNKWQQLVHRVCGGELVLVSRNSDKATGVCCKKCLATWNRPLEDMEWGQAKPEKVGPGLWVPGKPQGVL